jgi:hypothetical protein
MMNIKKANGNSSNLCGVTSEFRAKWLLENDVDFDTTHDILPRDVDADLSIAYLLYKLSLMGQ